MNAVNKVLDWITRLAFLNVLWISFSVLGLGILGLFPSTAATFTVARRWVLGETDIPIFKTFWRAYKKEFKNSNLLGYVVTVFGYILYLDFLFINVAANNFAAILTIPLFIVTILYCLTLIYIFPVFVHYDMKLLEVLKSSFFIMILNPLTTIVAVVGMLGIAFILWKFQGLALFFSLSIFSVTIMMPALRAFEKVNYKQQLFMQKNKEA